jgi:hypothetical protein
MNKTERYRSTLKELDEWEPFLLQESGLPGPRGNLELARVVADAGDEAQFARWRTWDAAHAPTNDPHEFLAFCGVLGLGRLLAEGQRDVLPALRRHAADPRWRIREAVAMALQRLGRCDMDALLHEMADWSRGSLLVQRANLLVQRAAAAALCEPAQLVEAGQVRGVLDILDDITAALTTVEDRRNDEFRALRKGLAYCWSVAVVALPAEGKACMERWFASDDRDVRWIMKQNLKKARLARVDADWVAVWQARLD